jgi:tRNA-specific 2-thiouridylase
VIRLDAEGARVVVGPREALATRTVVLRDVNWLGDETPEAIGEHGLDIAVRVRSTRQPRPARLRRTADGYAVDLAEREDGVSPGQAAVFYDGCDGEARVLGGGFIRSATQGASGRSAAPALA